MALTRRQPLASLGKQVDLRSGSSRHRRTGKQPDGNRFRRARRRTAPSWLSTALIEGTATGRAAARRLASKGSPATRLEEGLRSGQARAASISKQRSRVSESSPALALAERHTAVLSRFSTDFRRSQKSLSPTLFNHTSVFCALVFASSHMGRGDKRMQPRLVLLVRICDFESSSIKIYKNQDGPGDLKDQVW
jgi:hypothetical protein